MRENSRKIVRFICVVILSGGAIGALAGFYFIVAECIPYVLRCID